MENEYALNSHARLIIMESRFLQIYKFNKTLKVMAKCSYKIKNAKRQMSKKTSSGCVLVTTKKKSLNTKMKEPQSVTSQLCQINASWRLLWRIVSISLVLHLPSIVHSAAAYLPYSSSQMGKLSHFF